MLVSGSVIDESVPCVKSLAFIDHPTRSSHVTRLPTENCNFSPGELTPIDHGWDQLIVHPENERGEPHNVCCKTY